jgi:hypothetical protein
MKYQPHLYVIRFKLRKDIVTPLNVKSIATYTNVHGKLIMKLFSFSPMIDLLKEGLKDGI